MSINKYTGSCMCGKAQYEVAAPAKDIRGVTACHCRQCRKWSGHYWASIIVPWSSFTMTAGEENVNWYQSSHKAKRGFCKTCGSSLFWHGFGYKSLADKIDISAGSLNGLLADEHSLTVKRHIFCKFKGDYYELADGIPSHDTFPMPE